MGRSKKKVGQVGPVLGHDDVRIELTHAPNDRQVVAFGVYLEDSDPAGENTPLDERRERAGGNRERPAPRDLFGIRTISTVCPKEIASPAGPTEV